MLSQSLAHFWQPAHHNRTISICGDNGIRPLVHLHAHSLHFIYKDFQIHWLGLSHILKCAAHNLC